MESNFTPDLLFLGHSTVLVETPGGKRILIDPFLAHNPATPPEYKSVESLGKIDFLLITHLHNDHAMDAPAVIEANPDITVFCIPEVEGWLWHKFAVRPEFVGMNKGGTVRKDGIAITMTHADHSSSIEENGVRISGGEPVGFVVTLENGFAFYFAGDTALFGDMALIGELYKPSLALLPIGDVYTMGPREAAYAVKLLGVSHVIPIHYGTFPGLTGTAEAFIEAISNPEIKVSALEPGKKL